MDITDEISIEGLICLEAGAGNITRYLAEKDAKLVYSICNDREHPDYARKRLPGEHFKRVKFIKADLLKLDFNKRGEVEFITAHMLINVVTAIDLFYILKELAMVAKKAE